jgi:hypothetical protein
VTAADRFRQTELIDLPDIVMHGLAQDGRVYYSREDLLLWLGLVAEAIEEYPEAASVTRGLRNALATTSVEIALGPPL